MGNAKNNTDYHAAAQIVKAFCKLIDVSVDIKPLLSEAKKIEKAVNEHLKTMELQKDQNEISSMKKGTPMYI
jgi:predicted ATP-grasp superfamily ATP-dependent carboligase